MGQFLRLWRERMKVIPRETFGLFRNDLSSLMGAAAAAQTLGERVQWLESLLDWIRIPASPESNRVVSQIQSVRVRFFLQSLERNPVWRRTVSRLITSVLLETEAVSLLCETGLNTGDGIFTEASERILHKILPSPRDEKDLAELFSRVFSEESDAEWLLGLEEQTLQPFFALLADDEKIRQQLERHYRLALSEAVIILSSHLESLGLTPEIRLRSHVLSVRESAFYRLRTAVATALDEEAAPDFDPLFRSCQEEIASAFAHLEEHGVSVAIVYRLEKMERFLGRLRDLVAVYFAPPGAARSDAWKKLLAGLVLSDLERNRIRTLMQHNLHMLARKIVERTGASGEHYITSTRKEYFGMLTSAAGGGMLTVGTAHLKFLTGKLAPALFFDGFLSWINYSASFLLMQACHFTLATKQPSMTAPALAAKLKESQSPVEFTDLVQRITRSQFAAALGNIGMAIPVALVADFAALKLTGHHLIPAEYAEKTIQNLHPLHSLTIPYAALTGLILWVSSIGAGWAENWFVYRRLPETIRQSGFLGSLLGPKRAAKLSDWICHNISGIGGSITLGFLLAFTPIAGKFFGLPLDVRHVTLSTCSLTFAFVSRETFVPADLAWAVVSILLIGLMNFGVSFIAALFIAFKARALPRGKLRQLARAIWQRAKRSPWEFLFPVKATKN